MLFDLRGRRKRVIQVIYVLLAIIMAASLLVIGLPGGINPFSNTGGTSDLAQISIDRAENLEARLVAEPNNPNAQAELIRARVAAGRSLTEIADDGTAVVGDEAKAQYDLAAQAWDKYLRLTKNQPDPTVAQLMAGTLFALAQGSTVAQFQTNISDAARAQQLVAESAEKQFKAGEGPAPTGALVTLATYQYYAQDVEAADRNRQKAIASTKDDAEQKQIRTQLDAARKEGERIGKIIDRAKKQASNTGEQALDNPLGSLGTPDATTGAPAQP
jgi:hypothetical protein